jgi:predicted dehydrogenase
MNNKNKFSRRDFIRFSALGAAGAVMMPQALSAAVTPVAKTSKKSANDTITIGCIGLGQQMRYLINGFLTIPGVRIVAGADLYDVKRARFERQVNDYYTAAGAKSKVKTYENYQDILSRSDIDAVIIATPDHYHAVIAVAALKAGKDVYLEKPMTLTIFEGQRLIEAVRANNRILQVGSQQRSSSEFIHCANLIRAGKLGKISRVKVHVGGPPVPYDLPEQPIPAGLDWDKWLGPLNEYFHYNEQLNPPISLDPPVNEKVWGAWRWYKGMGGGYTTDWGAHMFDITQWALGKDRSGPVRIIPPGYSYYDHLTYLYDNGVMVTEEQFDGGKKGCKFYGDKGWLQVQRGEVLASDPEFLLSESATADGDVPFETKVPHMEAFIRAVRSRRDPNVPVEVGHSSATMCTLGNIAYELNRPLDWNPIVEKFVDDPQADKLLSYQYRDGYEL